MHTVVTTCNNVHILMTSRITLGALQDVKETVLVLKELNIKFTLDLFISRTREISDEERKEFLENNNGANGSGSGGIGNSPMVK